MIGKLTYIKGHDRPQYNACVCLHDRPSELPKAAAATIDKRVMAL